MMADVIPALRVKFGQIEYFVSYMHVNDILNHVKFPEDLEGWSDLSIEEKFQREINFNRVKKDIAPYFASDDTRFSGALVLAIQNHESIEFEPLKEFQNIRKLYQTAAEGMGFLIFSGKEQLVPLDGQHRIKAFEFATTGIDNKEKPIPGLKTNRKLGEDQVAVVLIRFEPTLARRIFSKINRYAKPTSKGDNLITDDDDSMAVMARKLIGEDGVIPSRLVRLRGNTLKGSAHEFTTFSTFYEANKRLFATLCATGEGTPSDMTEDQINTHVDGLREEWDGLLSNIDHWVAALQDPEASGDQTRQDVREQTVLGKPIGQLSLVGGYSLRLQEGDKIERKTLFRRINAINWSVENDMWHNVLMTPTGRAMAGRTVAANASRFIAYMIGAKLDADAKNELATKIYGNPDTKLPPPVVNVRGKS